MRTLPVGGSVEGLIHLKGRDVSFAGRVAWAANGDPRLAFEQRPAEYCAAGRELAKEPAIASSVP